MTPPKMTKVIMHSVLGMRSKRSHTRFSASSHRQHTLVQIRMGKIIPFLYQGVLQVLKCVLQTDPSGYASLQGAPHTFSIGFMSGLFAGHSIRSIPWSSKKIPFLINFNLILETADLVIPCCWAITLCFRPLCNYPNNNGSLSLRNFIYAKSLHFDLMI